MIECDPTASVEVVNVVFPLLSVPVPNVVLPSLNVTVPVAAEGVTVAVKVTDEPYVEGFAEDESAVEVFVFAEATELKTMQASRIPTTRHFIRVTMHTSPSSLNNCEQ